MDELELIRSAFPDAVIEWAASGDARGDWDSNRIHQVLGNLLSNAIKYGADAPIQVHLEGGPEAVVFSVTNQGVQIAPEYIASLFEPLNRAGRDDHDGLGLGLYIAQQVAVAHGGRIEATSSGTITRFTVTLPRAPSA
jgi:signal transduction histidine kinase